MATYDTEKHEKAYAEDAAKPASSSDTFESEFTLAEQRKIIHRIDRRLVVTVGVLYCISLMDRTNLSAAALAGYAVLPSYGMTRGTDNQTA